MEVTYLMHFFPFQHQIILHRRTGKSEFIQDSSRENLCGLLLLLSSQVRDVGHTHAHRPAEDGGEAGV